MATHDAEAGTGGLDASIFFELDRAENPGSAFNNSFGFFYGFHTVRTTAADLVALGVVTASGACNGPKVQLRGGRVDATEAGPAGVPEPQTDLESTLATFEKAGFTKEDMIAMVACGHTLGGVHSVDFPDLTEIPADPNNDTSVPFQKDISSIHNGVVTEYLDGSTRNPLVVAANDTLNSDKRIFASDGNATMAKMQDTATFQSMCGDIFTRMIDTVPGQVELSDVIEPYDVKPYITGLYLNDGGNITFQGSIRLRVTQGSNRTYGDMDVDLLYADRSGQGQTVISAEQVTYQGGITSSVHREQFVSFTFDTTISSDTGISRFWVRETTKSTSEVTTHDNKGTGGYPVNDTILYQLPQSCFNTAAIADGMTPMTVVAMIPEDRKSDPLTLEVVHKIARQGVIVPELRVESVNFEGTNTTRSGWAEFRAETKVEGTTTFDIVLGGDTPSTLEFVKTGTMPNSCTP